MRSRNLAFAVQFGREENKRKQFLASLALDDERASLSLSLSFSDNDDNKAQLESSIVKWAARHSLLTRDVVLFSHR